MNYNKSVSLLLASAVASSSFATFVGAKPYANLSGANVKVQEVEQAAGEKVFTIKGEVKEAFELGDLRPGSRKTFIFPVTNRLLESNRLKAEGEAVLQEFADLGGARNDYTDDDNAKANAKAVIKALNWIAEVNGRYAGTPEGAALTKLAREIAFQVSNATSSINLSAFNGPGAALTGSDFGLGAAAGELPDGAEDIDDADNRVQNSLCMEDNNGANAKVRMGICVGDAFTPDAYTGANCLPGNLKYKVISSAEKMANINMTAAAVKLNGAQEVTDAVIDGVKKKDATYAKTNTGGAFDNGNTFFSKRKADQTVNDNKVIVSANAEICEQLEGVVSWLVEFFCFRAHNFLAETEALVNAKNKDLIKAAGAAYVGGGAPVAGTNLPVDYTVEITKQEKGKDLVALNQSAEKVKINGLEIPMLTVTLTAVGAQTKAAETAGEVALKGAANNKVKFGFAGQVLKLGNSAAEIKDATCATVEYGRIENNTEIDKKMAKVINEEYAGRPVTLVVVDASGDELGTVIYKDGKNVQPGRVAIEVEKDNATAAKAAKELTGSNNVKAIMVSLPNFKGNAEVQISLEALGLGAMKNGTSVYFTPVNTEDLPKITKLASQAKASADEDKALMGDTVKGKVENGKVKLTLNSDDAEDKDTWLVTTKEPSQIEKSAAEEDEGEPAKPQEQSDDEAEETKTETGKPASTAKTVEPRLVAENKTTTGSEKLGDAEVGEKAMTGAEKGTVLEGTASSAENTVPETGATAGAAALAVAALAAGAVALKKSRD